AIKGTMGTAVKTSAGCVWRKTALHSNTNSGPTPDSNVHDHPLKHMEHRGIFDSRCSGHMTGNRAHLEDYQDLSKVGSVTFGGSKGSISGKGQEHAAQAQTQPISPPPPILAPTPTPIPTPTPSSIPTPTPPPIPTPTPSSIPTPTPPPIPTPTSPPPPPPETEPPTDEHIYEEQSPVLQMICFKQFPS
ncbi:hypothetical protein Tco_0081044, partial [Tanacetum coccineum]